MYLLDQLKTRLDSVEADTKALVQANEWLKQNEHRFKDLPNAFSFVSCGVVYIDISGLSHNQVMQVVMAFGRPWKREPNGDKIDYTHPVGDFLIIRCHAGEPPPNCRIEYTEEVVPERTIRRAKIVCKPVTHSIEAAPTLTIDL